MSSTNLTPTSYLVLGLLAREGSSSPYDLKRRVAATLGHVWSFPHTLLYTEPSRLADLGLVTERRERHGRRRRLFTITDSGLAALRAWLARPSSEPTKLSEDSDPRGRQMARRRAYVRITGAALVAGALLATLLSPAVAQQEPGL